MNKRTCPACGGSKDFYSVVCRDCKDPDEWPKPLLGVRGSNHPTWKGGTRVWDKDGYLVVYAPDHPWPRANRMIREHIRVVELQIGRRLDDDECVHHVNGDKTDNSLENLELLKKGEHSEYHRKIEPPRRRDSLGRFLGGEKYV